MLDGKGAGASQVQGSCELACTDYGKCHTMLKVPGTPNARESPGFRNRIPQTGTNAIGSLPRTENRAAGVLHAV